MMFSLSAAQRSTIETVADTLKSRPESGHCQLWQSRLGKQRKNQYNHRCV